MYTYVDANTYTSLYVCIHICYLHIIVATIGITCIWQEMGVFPKANPTTMISEREAKQTSAPRPWFGKSAPCIRLPRDLPRREWSKRHRGAESQIAVGRWKHKELWTNSIIATGPTLYPYRQTTAVQPTCKHVAWFGWFTMSCWRCWPPFFVAEFSSIFCVSRGSAPHSPATPPAARLTQGTRDALRLAVHVLRAKADEALCRACSCGNKLNDGRLTLFSWWIVGLDGQGYVYIIYVIYKYIIYIYIYNHKFIS